MDELIEFVEQYRRAQKLTDEKTRLLEAQLAAEGLVKRAGPRLKAFVRRACRQPETAEDVCQNIFVSIATNLGKFRGKSERELLRWCYVIARRAVAEHFRRKRVPEQLDPFDEESMWQIIEASGTTTPISPGVLLDLEYAMSLLGAAKPPCRGFLWSYFIRDMDYDEIAKEYGLTYDALRVQVTRCLELAISLVAKHD